MAQGDLPYPLAVAILTELRTIRQLLEKADQRVEREEELTRRAFNAPASRDPAVEGQRAMMAGEK